MAQKKSVPMELRREIYIQEAHSSMKYKPEKVCSIMSAEEGKSERHSIMHVSISTAVYTIFSFSLVLFL
jgi:hypothetical protein